MASEFERIYIQKRNRRAVLLIVLFCMAIAYISYIRPRNINVTYNAIEYQIGNPQIEIPVKINIDGYYYNKLLSSDTFGGKVIIDGKELNVNKLQVNLQGNILSKKGDEGRTISYGSIYANHGMKAVTVCIFSKGGWTSKDGFMISAPCKNREEALKISNNLLSKYLVHKIK